MKKILLLLLGVVIFNSCTTTTDSNGTKTTTVVPLPPSNLKGQAISTTEINLSWTDNSTNELGFKIERKTGTGTYSVINTTNSNIVTINDTNLTPSTTYTYRIYAYNNTGNSLTYSNEITITTNTLITLPILTTTIASSITGNSAVSGGIITSDGGTAITARGIVWNTNTNPTISNSKTSDGIGIGNFTSNLQNLNPATTYYVRSYATNTIGTSYGNEITFTTLTPMYASLYPSGTVFCNNVVTAVIDVINPVTGKTWMDRNLGATRVATSSTDGYSYGDSYQWGRRSDGHQCRNSIETYTLSSTDQPSNGSFIATLVGGNNDWRSAQNNNLWQGVNGQNNPCPSGYRLPTETEFEAERLSWSSGGFASPLKLTKPGVRGTSGSFGFVGSIGNYWSSTIFKSDSRTLWVTGNNNDGSISQYVRGVGSSVRCIKN